MKSQVTADDDRAADASNLLLYEWHAGLHRRRKRFTIHGWRGAEWE